MEQASHSLAGQPSAVLTRLQEVQRALPDLEVRPGTSSDTVDGLVPSVVVTPRTTEHVASVVRVAYENGFTVTPCGAGTQTEWGGVLEGADVLLDLAHLRRVVEYHPADMTVTVEAGCPLSELQRLLAEKGQFLPIDPPLDDWATIGGIVATNAAGPMRLGYGTLRDYILGVRAVRADGSVVRVGGRVVKNAAGYEMTKLFTGSFGTLGILTEITFMVRPVPQARSLLYLPLSRLDVIEPVVATLLDSQLHPTLLELFNTAAAELFPQGALPDGIDEAPYSLVIGFMGSEAAVEWQIDRTLALLDAMPKPSGSQLRGIEMPWELLYPALMSVRRTRPGALALRASLLSSEVAAFIDRAEAVLRSHQLRTPMVAAVGSGVVHLYFDPVPTDISSLIDELSEAARTEPTPVAAPALGPITRVATAARWAEESALNVPGLGDLYALRRLVTRNLTVESAPRDVRRSHPIIVQPYMELSERIRHQLDPQRILNRGRLVKAEGSLGG